MDTWKVVADDSLSSGCPPPSNSPVLTADGEMAFAVSGAFEHRLITRQRSVTRLR
jgi:hypothetical protein